MLDDSAARLKREAEENQKAASIAATDEANRKKNAERRTKEQAKKEARAERERILEVPPTIFELESQARKRTTYMGKVCEVFSLDGYLRAYHHESKNRVQRINTWRKKYETLDLEVEIQKRAGAGDDVLDPIRDEKNEHLQKALFHWYVAGEMYRKFKQQETKLRGGQSGDEGTD